MTDWAETCRPDIYNIVYKINVVLLADVKYLFFCVLLKRLFVREDFKFVQSWKFSGEKIVLKAAM